MSTQSAVRLPPQPADRLAAKPSRAHLVLRWAPVLAVVFVGLGAIMHFLPGRPVLTVDGFFHLSNTFNCVQDTRSWTTLTSTGQLSTSLGLVPVDCSIALLQSTHLPFWVTEALFEALLGISGAAGMYLAAGKVGQILSVRSRIAAIGAAVFWVANPFALSYIWYHVMYVQVLWAALPWLCLFVLKAEEPRRIGRLCLTAFGVAVVASPGLTEGELPQTIAALAFIALFVGVTRGRGAFLGPLL